MGEAAASEGMMIYQEEGLLVDGPRKDLDNTIACTACNVCFGRLQMTIEYYSAV